MIPDNRVPYALCSCCFGKWDGTFTSKHHHRHRHRQCQHRWLNVKRRKEKKKEGENIKSNTLLRTGKLINHQLFGQSTWFSHAGGAVQACRGAKLDNAINCAADVPSFFVGIYMYVAARTWVSSVPHLLSFGVNIPLVLCSIPPPTVVCRRSSKSE